MLNNTTNELKNTTNIATPPLKVLHIIGSLRLGGAQVCLRQIVSHSDKRNIISLVYPLRQQHIDMPCDAQLIKHSYRNYDPRKLLAIIRACRKYNIDIIHAHLEKPIVAALLLKPFCHTRVIIHEHGPVSRPGWKYALYRLSLRLLAHRADAIIACSHHIAHSLQKITALPITTQNTTKPIPEDTTAYPQITVIHNAVNTKKFRPDPRQRQQTRTKYNITTNDKVIGYIGRLNHVKGVDLLIKALPTLLHENPDYLLLLAGDGPEMQPLKKLARQLNITHRVRFLGFCSDVPRIISAFDIAVIPSRQEPFGIVALEIMLMGIPLVCSGVDGLSEIITHNKTGLITTPNTPQQIAHCIKKLSTSPNLAQKLTQNAQTHAAQFSTEIYTKRIDSIYRNINTKNHWHT